MKLSDEDVCPVVQSELPNVAEARELWQSPELVVYQGVQILGGVVCVVSESCGGLLSS